MLMFRKLGGLYPGSFLNFYLAEVEISVMHVVYV